MKRPSLDILCPIARRLPDGLQPLLATSMTAVLAVASAALLLAGCASPGAPHAPLAMTPPAAIGLVPVAADAGTPSVDAQWWRAFGDPALDALVERALVGQPGLQAAAARLTRAQALTETRSAAEGPQLGLDLSTTRQRFSENGLIPPPFAGSLYNTSALQAGGSWEFDFFGRNRSALDAALGSERAAAAELAAARTVLAANIAHAYVGLARLLAQRDVAERTLAQREETRALTRQRVRAGLDTQVELKQADGALPDARQQIEALNEQAQLARHQLAALSAQPPEALAGLKPSLKALNLAPLPPQIGLDLLARRADVVAARWRVEASTQDVASAHAEFYPNISLVGFAGLSSMTLERLVQAGSRVYGIGPALHLPLFDAGRLRANLHVRHADLDAAIAAYNGALFDAAREVADAGASAQSIARQQVDQAAAQADAESAYDFALQRYRAGLGPYLIVLAAENAVLAQRRLGTELRARQLDTQVALSRALGGGYTPDVAETPVSGPQAAR